MKYRPDVDGLRAFAIIPVLFFHVGVSGFTGGFVGVDIFFVISGFLITGMVMRSVLANEFSFAAFYIKRVRRLVPAIIATVIVSSIFAFLIMPPGDLEKFGGSAIFSLTGLSNIWFYNEAGYWDAGKYTKPLLHTWSLAVEEQFYVFWPLFTLILAKFRRVWMLTFLAVAFVGSLTAAEIMLSKNPSAVFYLMPYRIFEFCLGAGLTFVTVRRYEAAALIVGLAMICASVFLFSESTAFPGLSALLPCFGAALCIYGGRSTRLGFVLNNPLAVNIGKISYSLYLTHWPVVVFAHYLVAEKFDFVDRTIMITISLITAILSYFLIEKPFRTGTRFSSRQVVLGSLLTALLVAVPMASMWGGDGWTWRIEKKLPKYQYGGFECKYPFCALDGAGEELTVTGDSHGRMYYAGLLAVNNAEKPFSIFHFDSWCRFFNDQNQDRNYKCEDRLDRYLAYIDKNQVKSILIAHRWTNVGLHRPGLVRGEYVADKLKVLLDNPRMSSVENVIFILNPPELKIPVATCMEMPTYIINRSCEFISLDQLGYIEILNEQIFTALLRLDLGHRKLRIIDPFNALCDKEQCMTVMDGKTLFNDDHHLTELGSQYVVESWGLNAVW